MPFQDDNTAAVHFWRRVATEVSGDTWTEERRAVPGKPELATLAVEAAVHYLDLTVDLPFASAPDPASLRLVRRVLDGLLGVPVPLGWDDRSYALKGTGRLSLIDEERTSLGPLAERFPLFG